MSKDRSEAGVVLAPGVRMSDLVDAIAWLSGLESLGNRARVSRATGEVFWSCGYADGQDELPIDIADTDLYVDIPTKDDLALGRPLVLRFVREHVPHALHIAHEIFARPGAWRRFRGWLEQEGRLQDWFDFEARATQTALRAWAARENLRLHD